MTKTMSPTILEYVRSVNDHDPAAFRALFIEDAEVNDAGRQLRGIAEIVAWSNKDIFEANVTFEVLDVAERDYDIVLRTKVDGNFDRTGLPDPVVIDHCLRTEAHKIVRLTCQLAIGPQQPLVIPSS